MRVLSDEVVGIIKKLVDLGVEEFSYLPPTVYRKNGMVDVGFMDDDGQKVTVAVRIERGE